MIDFISQDSGYSRDDVSQMLDSLGNVIKDKLSDDYDEIHMSIKPGLCIDANYITVEDNQKYKTDLDYILKIKCSLSKRTKMDIKHLHNLKIK